MFNDQTKGFEKQGGAISADTACKIKPYREGEKDRDDWLQVQRREAPLSPFLVYTFQTQIREKQQIDSSKPYRLPL